MRQPREMHAARIGDLLLDHARTRAALAQKNAEGKVLGNRTNLADASAKGADANRAAADAFAANVLPVVRQIEASGVKGSRAIAAALNARGVRTARGGEWHATTVRNLMGREVGWPLSAMAERQHSARIIDGWTNGRQVTRVATLAMAALRQ
jgi:Recombinase